MKRKRYSEEQIISFLNLVLIFGAAGRICSTLFAMVLLT